MEQGEIIMEYIKLTAQFNNIKMSIEDFELKQEYFEMIERLYNCKINQEEFKQNYELGKEQGMKNYYFSLKHNAREAMPMFTIEL